MQAFAELGEEATSTLFFAGLEPESSLLERFAGAIGHLSWSNRRLTQLVRGEAAEERSGGDACAAGRVRRYRGVEDERVCGVAAERGRSSTASRAVESMAIVGRRRKKTAER